MSGFDPTCPICHAYVRRRWRFTTPWGTRRIAPCPHCGAPIRWAPLPWWGMNILMAVIFVNLVLEYRGVITMHWELWLGYVVAIFVLKYAMQLIRAESTSDTTASKTIASTKEP